MICPRVGSLDMLAVLVLIGRVGVMYVLEFIDKKIHKGRAPKLLDQQAQS